MNAAPCSCRVGIKRIFGVSRSASRMARFCVPGMPKTCSMPSLNSASTSARAPVVVFALVDFVVSILKLLEDVWLAMLRQKRFYDAHEPRRVVERDVVV